MMSRIFLDAFEVENAFFDVATWANDWSFFSLPIKYEMLNAIVFYLLFSFLIVVKPHLYRSILTFTLFSLTGLFYFHDAVISMGTFFISCVVIIRHLVHHQKEPFSIRFLQRS